MSTSCQNPRTACCAWVRASTAAGLVVAGRWRPSTGRQGTPAARRAQGAGPLAVAFVEVLHGVRGAAALGVLVRIGGRVLGGGLGYGSPVPLVVGAAGEVLRRQAGKEFGMRNLSGVPVVRIGLLNRFHVRVVRALGQAVRPRQPREGYGADTCHTVQEEGTGGGVGEAAGVRVGFILRRHRAQGGVRSLLGIFVGHAGTTNWL